MKKLVMAAAFSLLAPLATTSAIADSSPALLGALDAAHVQSLDTADETRGKYYKIDVGPSWITNSFAIYRAKNQAAQWCAGRPFLGCTGATRMIETDVNTLYYAVKYLKFDSWRGVTAAWKKY